MGGGFVLFDNTILGVNVMADQARETEKTNKKAAPEHRARQQESGQLTNESLDKEQGPLSLTGTPFYPRMGEHAATISRIPTAAQRHQFAMQLQKTYGNRYIQRLVNGNTASPIQPPVEEEENPVQTVAGPGAERQNLPEKSPVQPALTPPTLDGYPDATRYGGMVVVRDNAWSIWINSSTAVVPDCIRNGVILHEQKHVADFSADAEYRNFPTTGGASNGQTFYYGSSADARRFETAAVAVESAWIRNQLARTDLSQSDRTILQNRVDRTLPNYIAGM
jgi:hypothetical protein